MTRIDHVGIAVSSIEEAARLYTMGLELGLSGIETIEEQGVRVGMLPVGEADVELLEPLGPDSPVARFLAKRGEGVHHLCLQVDDIVAVMAHLREQGIRLVNDEPTRGAGGCLVAFVHPSSAHGVLLELSQKLE